MTIGRADAEDRQLAAAAGLELTPVSLQQLIIRKTNTPSAEIGVNS